MPLVWTNRSGPAADGPQLSDSREKGLPGIYLHPGRLQSERLGERRVAAIPRPRLAQLSHDARRLLSVFKELADLFVTLLRQGVHIGQSFIPDISVGQRWSKHWTAQNLDVVYGPRLRYEHNCPAYFPQAASNPQAPYCYPDDALGEFRKWVREVYIARHMPGYLNDKVRQGAIAAPVAQAALQAFEPPPTRLLPRS